MINIIMVLQLPRQIISFPRVYLILPENNKKYFEQPFKQAQTFLFERKTNTMDNQPLNKHVRKTNIIILQTGNLISKQCANIDRITIVHENL